MYRQPGLFSGKICWLLIEVDILPNFKKSPKKFLDHKKKKNFQTKFFFEVCFLFLLLRKCFGAHLFLDNCKLISRWLDCGTNLGYPLQHLAFSPSTSAMPLSRHETIQSFSKTTLKTSTLVLQAEGRLEVNIYRARRHVAQIFH